MVECKDIEALKENRPTLLAVPAHSPMIQIKVFYS